MLGSVVRTLTSRPILTRAEIEAAVAEALAEGPAHPLGLSDLAEQPDIVRLTPLPLTMDELSTLWSSFFQTPYRLSVAYEACVVVLTADDTPTRSLPVQTRGIFTTTMLRPMIVQAMAVDGPFAPVQVGSTLVLSGQQLRGEELTGGGLRSCRGDPGARGPVGDPDRGRSPGGRPRRGDRGAGDPPAVDGSRRPPASPASRRRSLS